MAGVGAFTSAQLAIHLGLNMLVGGIIGAALAAAVAVVLALLSLRLRGLGLALMTLAAALLFDSTFFNAVSITGGTQGPEPQAAVARDQRVLQLQRACALHPVHGRLVHCGGRRPLGAQGNRGPEPGRPCGGSEMAAAGLGINLTWQRIVVFALAGAIAGFGGVVVTIQQQVASP